MLQRELEPELMEDADESQAYDEMDHSAVNQKFVEELLALGPIHGDVLDLGTGPARIPIELCRRCADCRVMASDAATSMLDIAKANIDSASLLDRIQLHHGDSKALEFEDEMFDAVISNSLLHHLPDPQVAVFEMLRVLRSGGRIFVRDLLRPDSREEVELLVAAHTADEPPESQQLFRQSLHAALTLDEIRQFVDQSQLSTSSVEATSDRHWTWAATKR